MRPFLLDQDRRVDPTGRIVERDHKVVQPIEPDQPAVARAVLEQQHARQRPPWTLLAMRRPALGLLHQPRSLQGQPGHRVAQPIAMVALKLLVRMLGRVIEIALTEQRAGPGEFPGIRPPRRGLAKTPILQPLGPVLRVAQMQPPELPARHPKQFPGLLRCQTALREPVHNILKSHHEYLPEHPRPPHRHLPNRRRTKRTTHALQKADNSLATNIPVSSPCA